MNPCPCGYYGAQHRPCQCSPLQIRNYLHRISGPLLDRIDLQISVDAVDPLDLRQREDGERSEVVRARVVKARERQQHRLADVEIHCNAQMRPKELRHFCALDASAERMFTHAIEKMGLSARAHDRVLKVARTIADLDSAEHIVARHIAEAIQYRQLDRIWEDGAA